MRNLLVGVRLTIFSKFNRLTLFVFLISFLLLGCAEKGLENDIGHQEVWFHTNLKIHDAWKITKGKNVIIAVLDSGVNNIPELSGSLQLPGYNAIDDSTNVNDDEGHGTFIASIIGANSNKSDGYIGIAPESKLLPVKVFSKVSSKEENMVYLIKGLKWSINHGAQIVNISLGYYLDSPELSDTIREAISKGIIIVAAAGNNDQETLLNPAKQEGVIGVGATDKRGHLLYNGRNQNNKLILAPGENILSLSSSGVPTNMNGTSVSTPIISGIAALKKSLDSSCDSKDFDLLLRKFDSHGNIDVPQLLKAHI